VYKYKLSDSSKIFTTESFAILKAIHLSQEHNIPNTTIYSDSFSAINNLKNLHGSSDIIRQIQNFILKITNKGSKIQIFWIPGYSRKTKRCRKQKKQRQFSLITHASLISKNDVQLTIKIKCYQTWQVCWNIRLTKLHEIKQNVGIPMTTSTGYIKKNEVALNKLRIGHSQISHNFLMNKKDPPICSSCGVQLSIKHIPTECVRKKFNLSEHISTLLSNSSDSTK